MFPWRMIQTTGDVTNSKQKCTVQVIKFRDGEEADSAGGTK